MKAPADQPLIFRYLSQQSYSDVFQMMKQFTESRQPDTADEIWLLEHDPVFTQGQAGKTEHVLMPGDIPIVQADRGGQVTYHGPGQLIGYLLLNLKRLGCGVRELVTLIEQTLIDSLAQYSLEAAAKPDAPGVYVDGAKIASLGLRVRRGCSYHGFALNVNMDLEPFARINPCGYAGMKMVDMAGLLTKPELTLTEVRGVIQQGLQQRLGYTRVVTHGSTAQTETNTDWD
ncbi:lipoyl(octanoyl) transferase LipB [Spartinivicinus poritis]|uniref:Octanoyltransferase n=1 Tax=Spartinivicinus poritis TaxID=2994640 RepID=A0ABT5U670_9GAMM|nr:lipoyl(octanoyl) transferase LipB [Spartinivicinus sp. A2-2]MDE1461855.1 lipoyl(octanoyl) transferase LipB [Spartinivicinus sp. A2-2]